MKKIILAVIAVTMLISNAAFASTKTANANSTKTKSASNVNGHNVIHLDTQDPY